MVFHIYTSWISIQHDINYSERILYMVKEIDKMSKIKSVIDFKSLNINREKQTEEDKIARCNFFITYVGLQSGMLFRGGVISLEIITLTRYIRHKLCTEISADQRKVSLWCVIWFIHSRGKSRNSIDIDIIHQTMRPTLTPVLRHLSLNHVIYTDTKPLSIKYGIFAATFHNVLRTLKTELHTNNHTF